MKKLKSYQWITQIKTYPHKLCKGANLLRMPKQNIITNNDVMALFGGLTKLIGEYNPKFSRVFSNYQTLYIAFSEAQKEIEYLKAEIVRIKKST